MGLVLGLIANDLVGLPKTKVSGRYHIGILRRSKFMATSPNGVEWELLGRITASLLPQFVVCQKEISEAVERRF